MFYPLIYERVRLSDRADEYIVLSVDHAARVADIHLLDNPKAIESRVPFGQLSAAGDSDLAPDGACTHERWVSATQCRLRSADAHMRQSSVLLADLHSVLLTTMEAIRTSQNCLVASDRLIVRAQTLGCDESRPADGDYI